MSKDLIREHIQQRALGKTAVLPKRWDIKYEVKAEAPLAWPDAHIRYDMSVKVSTQSVAPADAAHEVRETAIRTITHELYGGLHQELWELFKLLHEDQYWPPAHPVMAQLNRLMEMTRP